MPRNFLASTFFGITFHKNSISHLIFATVISTPPPKSTVTSAVVTITKDMMEKKRIKTKIGVGSVVKKQVREM